MQRSKVPLYVGAALLAYALFASQHDTPQPDGKQPATPKVQPKTPAKPKKPANPCPNCPHALPAREALGGYAGQLTGTKFPQIPSQEHPAGADRKPQLGGIESPDGTVRSVIWLDSIDWPKNIAAKGLGCCGFRSLDYCARMQGVESLVDWPEQLRNKGYAGGAYPEKVEKLLHEFAPGVAYWQDCSKSHALLEACVRSQRGCAVDYNGRDPHYSGRIAHCVTLIAFDEASDWVAIIDNNYPSLDEIVWMSVKEFDQRWGGWAYGLLQITPGYCPGKASKESWEFFPGKDGTINYGMEIRQGGFGEFCKLNGSDSTTDAIIEAIGPAMMPIPVNVDHRFEPIRLDFTPLQIALAGGAVLMFYTLSRKDN